MTPSTLTEMQRKAAFEHMGEQARALLRDGYRVEADKLLDKMIELKEQHERSRDPRA